MKRSPLTSKVFVDGFLDPSASEWSQRFRREYRDWAKLFRNVNRLGVNCLVEMKIDKDDYLAVAICVHYVRLLHDAQCAVKLLEIGAAGPSRVLLRTMVEAAFRLAALRKKPESVDLLAPQHNEQIRKFLGGLEASGHAGLSEEQKASMKEEANRLAAIPPSERKATSAAEWARLGGLSDLYETAYRHLSDAVHIGMIGLNEYLIADEHGDIHEVAWGASTRAPHTDYITAIEVICLAARLVEPYVSFSVEEDVDEILARMRSLPRGDQPDEEVTQ